MIERRKSLIEATERYCAAVAISLGNKSLREQAERAIENLIGRDVHITLHHIISTEDSVDEFLKIRERYGEDIHYHVLLPLVKHGRSSEGMGPRTFEYLEEKLGREKDLSNVAFGAKFMPYLEKTEVLTMVRTFPEHSYSKNVLLQKDKVVITKSSFDLEIVKTIDL